MTLAHRYTPVPASTDAMLESQVQALRIRAAPAPEPRLAGAGGSAAAMIASLVELARAQATEGAFGQARLTLDDAQALLRGLTDARDEAEARFAIGQVLLALAEPAARVMLEDAGTLFEELGDDAAVMRVDHALREAESAIEESPRSFQAR